MGCKADIDAEPIRFHANASSSIDVMRLDRTLGQSRYVACASSCISTRTSLEEGIKLHRFAGIFPEQFSTEAGRHREAVVAPIRVWSSVAFAITSSTMLLMCRPQSNAPALLMLHSGDIMKA